ncbi:MAG: hypothetical protein LBP74_10600 [Treponema sp.]|jgi:hypothetical protein|nr:hypothetical protein [Treponema sp.]
MASDYLSKKDGDFDTWFSFMYQYVSQKCAGSPPAWNHIPQAALMNLAELHTAWKTAYGAVSGPHTKVDTEAKNDAKKAAIAAIRPFVNQYLRYPPVTDEDRTAMGIHNRKTTHSPVVVPDTSPRLQIDTGTRRRIIIYYRDETSTRRGKPKGVHGIEVKWAILDHYPESEKELFNSSFDTSQPLTLVFDEADRGKHIYLMGLWEIEREGEKGPPGAIEEAIIP